LRFILFLKILLLLILNPLVAQTLGNYQLSLEGLYKLKHKASLSLPKSSFTLLEEYRGGKREYLHFNLSLPWSIFGHLYPAGLLKEIDKPGTYTADSTVFKEEAIIKADTSFRSNSLKGLVLLPLSFGQIFLLQDPDNNPQAGTRFRIPLNHSLDMELLFRFYRSGSLEEGYQRIKKETFLLDLPDLDFFSFLNSAVTLEGKEAGFFFSLLFGSSFSRFILPGGFLRFYGDLSLPKGRFLVVTSLVTPGYITEKGAFERGLFSLFTSLSVKSTAGVEILGRIGLPVELPWFYLQDFPDPSPGIIKPAGTLTLKTSNRLFKTNSSLTGRLVFRNSTTGSILEDYTWEARTSLSLKDFGDVSAIFTDEEGENNRIRLKFFSSSSLGQINIKIRFGVELGEPFSFYGFLSGEIKMLEGSLRLILASNGWKRKEDLQSHLSSLKGITLEYRSGNFPFIVEEEEE